MNPNDEVSAFERWEVSAPSLAASATLPPEVPAAEPSATRDAAYDEGYAAGLREGDAAAERIRQLADSFTRLFDSLDNKLAEALRDLALDVARQVIVGELAARPERIHDVVRMALQQMTETSREARLILHPDDAALIRARLEGALDRHRVRLVEDARMVRGGCRIETPHGDIDASLPARWRQIVLALGSHSNWMDTP